MRLRTPTEIVMCLLVILAVAAPTAAQESGEHAAEGEGTADDTGAETTAADDPGKPEQGWLTDIMWKLHPHFRLGAGFNFTDFSDNEFTMNDYSVRGWFLRAQGRY